MHALLITINQIVQKEYAQHSVTKPNTYGKTLLDYGNHKNGRRLNCLHL